MRHSSWHCRTFSGKNTQISIFSADCGGTAATVRVHCLRRAGRPGFLVLCKTLLLTVVHASHWWQKISTGNRELDLRDPPALSDEIVFPKAEGKAPDQAWTEEIIQIHTVVTTNKHLGRRKQKQRTNSWRTTILALSASLASTASL